jgi:hypothetical protein
VQSILHLPFEEEAAAASPQSVATLDNVYQ